ncbi:unnamed protein product [Auanema sp. JU1783]|nr:unnamed protein product [Auanema sp. JU1783]
MFSFRLLASLILASLAAYASTSYCGQSAVPFTFQSLRSGNPVLGCARPRCFGWNKNGTRAEDTAQFYRINGKEDGYLRRSDQLVRPSNLISEEPQTAQCSEHHRSTGCGEGEWIGGISPQTNAYKPELPVRCCSYAPLADSEDRGIAPIQQGQIFIGGEVIENDRLVAFDYISNIKKNVFQNGTIEYSVYVRRFLCSDSSEAEDLTVSNSAVLRNLDGDVEVKSKEGKPKTVAFGVPNTAQAAAAAPNNAAYNSPSSQAYSQPQLLQAVFPQVQFPQAQFSQPYLGYQQPQYNYQQQQQQQQQFGNQEMNVNQPSSDLGGSQTTKNVDALPKAPNSGILDLTQLGITPLPTLPPMTLPALEDLPKLEIPSVEDVENVIPPMQKAILTNIAKFFGVL